MLFVISADFLPISHIKSVVFTFSQTSKCMTSHDKKSRKHDRIKGNEKEKEKLCGGNYINPPWVNSEVVSKILKFTFPQHEIRLFFFIKAQKYSL